MPGLFIRNFLLTCLLFTILRLPVTSQSTDTCTYIMVRYYSYKKYMYTYIHVLVVPTLRSRSLIASWILLYVRNTIYLYRSCDAGIKSYCTYYLCWNKIKLWYCKAFGILLYIPSKMQDLPSLYCCIRVHTVQDSLQHLHVHVVSAQQNPYQGCWPVVILLWHTTATECIGTQGLTVLV